MMLKDRAQFYETLISNQSINKSSRNLNNDACTIPTVVMFDDASISSTSSASSFSTQWSAAASFAAAPPQPQPPQWSSPGKSSRFGNNDAQQESHGKSWISNAILPSPSVYTSSPVKTIGNRRGSYVSARTTGLHSSSAAAAAAPPAAITTTTTTAAPASPFKFNKQASLPYIPSLGGGGLDGSSHHSSSSLVKTMKAAHEKRSLPIQAVAAVTTPASPVKASSSTATTNPKTAAFLSAMTATNARNSLNSSTHSSTTKTATTATTTTATTTTTTTAASSTASPRRASWMSPQRKAAAAAAQEEPVEEEKKTSPRRASWVSPQRKAAAAAAAQEEKVEEEKKTTTTSRSPLFKRSSLPPLPLVPESPAKVNNTKSFPSKAAPSPFPRPASARKLTVDPKDSTTTSAVPKKLVHSGRTASARKIIDPSSTHSIESAPSFVASSPLRKATTTMTPFVSSPSPAAHSSLLSSPCRAPRMSISWTTDPHLLQSKVFVARLDKAAIVFQKYARRWQCRNGLDTARVAKEIYVRNQAATKVQCCWRRYQRKCHRQRVAAAIRVQAIFRGHRGQQKLRVLQLQQRLAVTEAAHQAELLRIEQDKLQRMQEIRDHNGVADNELDEMCRLQEGVTQVQETIAQLKQENRQFRASTIQLQQDCRELKKMNADLQMELAKTLHCTEELQKRTIPTLEASVAQWTNVVTEFEQRPAQFQEALARQEEYYQFEVSVQDLYRKQLLKILQTIEDAAKSTSSSDNNNNDDDADEDAQWMERLLETAAAVILQGQS